MPISALLAFVLVGLLGVGGWLWTPDLSRAELEAKYLASQSDLVDIAGVRLHVRDEGPADISDQEPQAVLLLHGFGSSLHTFDGWASKLARNYRVIRFDLAGSGLSQPDPSGVYTEQRTMEIILALLDDLGVGQAHVIGNSIGGRAAWRLAERHPDRVAKLVLISPDGFASQGFEYGRAPDVPIALQAMRYVLPEPMVRSNIAAAYADPTALSDATMARYYELMRAPGGRDALLHRLAQTVLEPPEPLLARITAPVLLLWGEKDALIPIANAQDYLKALPNARLVQLSNLGHVPHEEDPDTSIEPVLTFLAE